MKLREIVLQNFRGYYNETRIPINDLTALIGQNDVGKSTILEALDIFFNQSKIESGDKNIFHSGEETVIGCVFDELPERIMLEDVETSFSAEYLLNKDGHLEIHKKYPASGKQTIWIYAEHPSNEGFNNLLLKKNNELKAKIRNAHLEKQANLTINSDMRRTLWQSLGDEIALSSTFISADQADEKRLWPKIEPILPMYRLFKADRPSTDEDQEAQDPMQHAMKIALEEQADQLAFIAEEVKRKVAQVASNTIEKLRDFDPELASTLTPKFKKDPTWEKAFSFSLTGENSIPLNKRGSGIRRLVLFSFFRATTESKLFEGKNIIYAVEEPETSQHPDAQKMIVNTFREMTEKNGCQVIITTHVPGLAGMLPLESLRYITNSEGYPEVASGAEDEEMLKRIADTLLGGKQMIIRNALVYTEDHVFQKRDILIKGANFAEICPAGTAPCCDEKIVDASGCFAIPGLVDLHFHGCAGFDFSDGTEEAMHAIAAYEASVGVTSIIPATMTLGESQLQAICGTAAQYVKVQRQGEATLRGIHMEGPFFSIKKKGAQNPEHLRNPDIEMFRRLNQTSDGQIRIVSIAPELDGAMEFIEALRDETVISIAHTDADYETARLAIEHGVQHITHLYNAMPPFLHRAPGPIGAAADCKSCMVELICDGIHVHPAVVRSTFRMFGDDRIILISDSMRATGLQDGTYDLGGLSVTVCGQNATLADGTIAGSVTNLMDCVRIAVQQMGIPLETAVRCATENPAKSVGIYQWCGSISPGKRADVVLLSQDDLRLQQVILGGQQF